jgi:hypothetical protein
MLSDMKLGRIILWLLTLLGAHSCQQLPEQPNVIFVLADDLGWKDLGCYGSDLYETPHLDAFAASGMRFTDAYTASPLCSPTRASILTGLEPGRLRFTTPAGHLENVVLDPRESDQAQPWYKAATPQTRTRLPNEYLTFAEVVAGNIPDLHLRGTFLLPGIAKLCRSSLKVPKFAMW